MYRPNSLGEHFWCRGSDVDVVATEEQVQLTFLPGHVAPKAGGKTSVMGRDANN